MFACNESKILVYLHGGGYAFGTAEDCSQSSALAVRLQCRAVSIDYRLAPEYPYPAALEDTYLVFKELLKRYRADQIMVAGLASGGSLALAVTLKLRDSGLPMPAAVGLFSPWADIDRIGDTYYTLEGIAPSIDYEKNSRVCMEAYLRGHDPKAPLVSPVYADYSRGFAPVLIITGTRDMFLSNCARLQGALLKAGQDVRLIVFEGMGHSFSMMQEAPEFESALKYMSRFFNETAP